MAGESCGMVEGGQSKSMTDHPLLGGGTNGPWTTPGGNGVVSHRRSVGKIILATRSVRGVAGRSRRATSASVLTPATSTWGGGVTSTRSTLATHAPLLLLTTLRCGRQPLASIGASHLFGLTSSLTRRLPLVGRLEWGLISLKAQEGANRFSHS